MSRQPLDRDGLHRMLATRRVVPVLRADDEERLTALVEASLDAGLGAIELTATSPGWQRVLAAAVGDARFDGIALGVGTVTDARTAAEAADLGAEFLVSPFPAPDAVLAHGPLLVQGGLSPAEVAVASAGTGVAKLFPASSVGIGHLRALRDVLPDRAIMPTGGITLATAAEWLDAGAIAVGIGTALFREDPAELRRAIAALRRR